MLLVGACTDTTSDGGSMHALFVLRRIGMGRKNVMPLSLAAARLGVRWARAWDLLLRGDLVGEKQGARWYVTSRSVETMRKKLRQRAR